ncbi:hypothetical protein JYB87_01395 [Shewanella avicenniae]|uniref:Uncharacterized protein n=1 Tax=Shewanella avicenniae TaxID=2814294 RepID=A0ABX7QRA1_9GAMM|nr:hypothetical protein [Shewanella avicenniae]QSX33939.1 hypothetical protein JYB87_01395 [Shewanella avicenniae]
MLRSLICLKGYDQGLRHLAISLAVYLLIILLWGISMSGGFAAVVAIVLLPILLASAWRRVRDAAWPPLMTAVVVLPWLLMLSVTLTSTTGTVLYCALIFAALLHAGLAYLPNAVAQGARSQRHYVQGYCGPVALVTAKSIQRVEPTIGGASTVVIDDDTNVSGFNQAHVSVDIDPAGDDSVAQLQQNLQALGQWLMRYRIAALGSVLLLLVLSSIVGWWLSREDAPATQLPEQPSVTAETQVAREVVKMPDNFSLMLEGDKLILQWLGDTDQQGQMWQLAIAAGDKRCAEIVFNDGSRYRPMQVDVVANGAVEASFSPLDTTAIVNDVAMRGSFTLCGYEFGLKGSQAALQSNASFSRLLK